MTLWTFTFVFVAWAVAASALCFIRSKENSTILIVVTLMCTTLSAGLVQYGICVVNERVTRLSAAHLAGAYGLGLKQRAGWIKGLLLEPISNSQQPAELQIDWKGTFEGFADDLSADLSAVERNEYIRANYARWMADIEVHHHQLNRMAKRIATMEAGTARKSHLNFYLGGIEAVEKTLADLAHEMRSRSAYATYD